jgi:hypothetical protein
VFFHVYSPAETKKEQRINFILVSAKQSWKLTLLLILTFLNPSLLVLGRLKFSDYQSLKMSPMDSESSTSLVEEAMVLFIKQF